jgi:putative membrane protein
VSIRQYSPRRDRRNGISAGKQRFLNLTLGLAILLQISYPLIEGEPLRLVTLAIVYVGACAMLLHAYFSFGARYAFLYLLITFFFAFATEEIGMRTGWPFGTYHYGTSLGVKIFSLPLVVPFAWLMMAHPVLVAARRLTQNWVFLFGGAAMASWDLFLDPQMVSANRWTWSFTGAHVPFQSEVPLSNTFGWLFAGMGLIALLHLTLPRERRKGGVELVAVDIFILWTLFSGVVGNLFFFHRPGIALFAGLTFAILFAPYLFSRWFGRP